MDIFITLKDGFLRSGRNWKVVIINWIVILFLTILVAFPIRSVLRNIIGTSMITEKMAAGLNFNLYADIGNEVETIVSFFTSGFLLIIMTAFLLNVFVTGGLFSCLKRDGGKNFSSQFFMGSAANFWSFLVIMLIMSLIVIFAGFLIISVPVMIAAVYSNSEGVGFRTLSITGSVFLLILPLFLLVTDYARAWQVSNEKGGGFKAIGFGFRQTFRTLLSSYPLMLILTGAQLLFGWLVLKIFSGLKPVTGGGIFLLFLLFQFMMIITILLRLWRYGSVTSLMESKL